MIRRVDFLLLLTASFALYSKCLLFSLEVKHIVENIFSFLSRLYSIFLGHVSMVGQHLMARIRVDSLLNFVVKDAMTLMLGTVCLRLLYESKVALRLVVVVT